MTEHIAPVRAVITLTCPNAVGLSFEVDSVIADRGWNLTSSQQFVDPESHSFFMRSEVEHMDGEAALADIAIALQKLNAHLGTNIEIHDPRKTPLLVVLVGRFKGAHPYQQAYSRGVKLMAPLPTM